MESPSKPVRKQSLPDWALLACFSIACCLATVFVEADRAVAWSWPNNPYSPLWFWLNPGADTQVPWRLYLAAFQAVAFGAMIYFTGNRFPSAWGRRWVPPLPFKVAFVQIMVNLIFVMIHWDENITVVSFAWVAYYLWPWVLMILQKVPVGWSWNFQDAHVRCLSTCYFLSDGSQATLVNSFLYRDLLHYVVYAIIVFAFVYPVLARKDIDHNSFFRWVGRNLPGDRA